MCEVKKDFLSVENLKETAEAFRKSEYGISATGHRGVGINEFIDILGILVTMPNKDIPAALDNLFTYHPATISMVKYQQQQSCKEFDESNCDCFLPDVGFDNCYCIRERKRKLEEGDYRNVPEYREWRSSVFSRDNFTCQECGATGCIINAHHIKKWKDYPSLRYDINNGLTLCVSCHKSIHKKAVK